MSIEKDHALNDEDLKQYDKISTLTLFSIAEVKEESDKSIPSFHHKHEAYEFILPVLTIPVLHYDKANYPGEVGYVYPVNPNVEHGIFIEDQKCAVISIVVDREYLDAKKEECGYKGKYFYTRYLASKTLREFISQYMELDATEETIPSRDYLSELIIRELIIDGLATGEDNRRRKIQHSPKIKEALKYMFDNSSDPNLTIEDVARLSGYSTAYFTKAFRAFMDDTPINHLNKIRLSKAKHLFFNKELTLSEIAKMSGFKNTSTFTESFKRIMKMYPKDYRKKYCN